MYQLGRYRYVAHGTITNKKEEEISENIKNSIDKQRKGIEKELQERLHKVNMELKDIEKSIHQHKDNNINLYIENKKLIALINESKILLETALKLPTSSISKLNRISNNNEKILYQINY